MNIKRWLMASVAVLIVVGGIGWVLHHILLADMYKATASIWRPEAEMQNLGFWMPISHVIYSLVFVLIYAKGYEAGKGKIGQGLRYGIYVALLMHVTGALMWYVILPIPAALAVAWAVGGTVDAIISGIAAGLIYKD